MKQHRTVQEERGQEGEEGKLAGIRRKGKPACQEEEKPMKNPCGCSRVTFGGSPAGAHDLLLLGHVEPPHHVGQSRLQQLNLVLLHLDPLLQGGDAVGNLHAAAGGRAVI